MRFFFTMAVLRPDHQVYEHAHPHVHKKNNSKTPNKNL